MKIDKIKFGNGLTWGYVVEDIKKVTMDFYSFDKDSGILTIDGKKTFLDKKDYSLFKNCIDLRGVKQLKVVADREKGKIIIFYYNYPSFEVAERMNLFSNKNFKMKQDFKMISLNEWQLFLDIFLPNLEKFYPNLDFNWYKLTKKTKEKEVYLLDPTHIYEDKFLVKQGSTEFVNAPLDPLGGNSKSVPNNTLDPTVESLSKQLELSIQLNKNILDKVTNLSVKLNSTEKELKNIKSQLELLEGRTKPSYN